MTSDTGVASILGFEKQLNKDQPYGYPSLDALGKIPVSEIPMDIDSSPPSLDSQLLLSKFRLKMEASETLRASHDAIATTNQNYFVKLKTITFNEAFIGNVRIKFAFRGEGTLVSIHARIYKNGIAIGDDNATPSELYYSTITEDINLSLVANDTIELWGYQEDSLGVWVKNFRIYWDIVVSRSTTNS